MMKENKGGVLCWICEKRPAETGEHIIKNSIIKYVLGGISPEDPRLLHRYDGRRNIPINGSKNKNFKFEKSLCKECNEKNTQKHDESFDRAIKKLLRSSLNCISRDKVSIASIIGKDKEIKLGFELYLCKLLGCIIVDLKLEGAERVLEVLREAIKTSRMNVNNIHLSFFRDVEKLQHLGRPLLGQQTILDKDGIVFLCSLDWFAFTLTYPKPLANESLFGEPWEIGTKSRSIRLGKILKLSDK